MADKLEIGTGPYGTFHYWPQDEVSSKIAGGAFWDEHFRPYFEALAPDDLLVDVGAHIGFFTIYSARRGVRVEAFEPSPEIFAVLEANIAANHVGHLVNAHCVPLFDRATAMKLSPTWGHPDKDGQVDFALMSNTGGFCLVPGDGDYRARTLDSYAFEGVKLLKTDAQGADVRILHGSRDTIQRCRPVICYEIESFPAQVHNDSDITAMEYLKGLDYDVKLVHIGGGGYFDFVAFPR